MLHLIIKGFEWDRGNIDHILERHHVFSDEVEEVFVENPIVRKTHTNRRLAMGKTLEGRWLVVVFEIKKEYIIRPVTARDMTRSERRYYKKHMGVK